MILCIEIFADVNCFGFSDLHQGVWFSKWNEKNKKQKQTKNPQNNKKQNQKKKPKKQNNKQPTPENLYIFHFRW